MPDVTGQPLRQALTALAPLGIPVEIAGHGIVVHQSPAARSRVASGVSARLTLLSPASRIDDVAAVPEANR